MKLLVFLGDRSRYLLGNTPREDIFLMLLLKNKNNVYIY